MHSTQLLRAKRVLSFDGFALPEFVLDGLHSRCPVLCAVPSVPLPVGQDFVLPRPLLRQDNLRLRGGLLLCQEGLRLWHKLCLREEELCLWDGLLLRQEKLCLRGRLLLCQEGSCLRHDRLLRQQDLRLWPKLLVL